MIAAIRTRLWVLPAAAVAKTGRMQVAVLVGGTGHASGGMGTLLQYLADEWSGRHDAPDLHIIDTRGTGGVVGGICCFARGIGQLLWLRASGRVDVVHAHMTTRGSVFRKYLLCGLAGLLGVPSVIHMHGADFLPYFARQPWRIQARIRAVLRRAAHVVVLGNRWRDFMIAGVGLVPGRVSVVLNGVRDPARKSAQGPEAGPLRILFLGRLGERKGTPDLLEALASPALQGRAWTAVLAGDGDVEAFRVSACKSGLAARVTFPGWVSRAVAADLLDMADILVLPSHHEAMPMAVVEAMAYRLAIVTTPVGAVPEFLRHDSTALFVTPGKPQELADALVRLIDDPATRLRLSQAARAAFLARLDVAAAAERLMEIFRTAIDAGARAGSQTG